MTLSAFFRLPHGTKDFVRDLAALLLPLLAFEILAIMGLSIHLWGTMILALSILHTSGKNPFPLLLGVSIFFLVFIGQSTLYPWASTEFTLSILVGLMTPFALLFIDTKWSVFQRLVDVFRKEMEYRRQAMHLTVGVTMTIFLYYGILHTWLLGALIPVALLFIYLLKKRQLPLLEKALLVFERAHHFEKFPGRGSLCFLIGGFLATAFFSHNIALASILVLAFGDSITNIAGGYYGRFPLPYNKHKNIEGPLVGALFAAGAASIFVPFPIAFAASMVAMFVETIPMKLGTWEVDDNITIPVVAGIVMTLLLAF